MTEFGLTMKKLLYFLVYNVDQRKLSID